MTDRCLQSHWILNLPTYDHCCVFVLVHFQLLVQARSSSLSLLIWWILQVVQSWSLHDHCCYSFLQEFSFCWSLVVHFIRLHCCSIQSAYSGLELTTKNSEGRFDRHWGTGKSDGFREALTPEKTHRWAFFSFLSSWRAEVLDCWFHDLSLLYQKKSLISKWQTYLKCNRTKVAVPSIRP